MITKALKIATEAHDGQVRKYTSEPYIFHPIRVYEILRKHGIEDEDTLVAAILHDVVEDTSVTLDDIEANFNASVALLVDKCTQVSIRQEKLLSRTEKWRMNAKHYASGCEKVHNIKMADMIDNCDGMWHLDEKFAKVYMEEKYKLARLLNKRKDSLYAHWLEIEIKYYRWFKLT